MCLDAESRRWLKDHYRQDITHSIGRSRNMLAMTSGMESTSLGLGSARVVPRGLCDCALST